MVDKSLLNPIDLHSHSTASDGGLTPTELVQRAAERGVQTLALTDHDSTEGVVEAQQAAAQYAGFRLIPGVEMSVTWNTQVIHVLGLNIDIHNAALQKGLLEIRVEREQRARKMGEELEKIGITGAYEGAKAFATGGLISRTHFAHYLVKQGLASQMSKIFQHYLVRGKPGYVSTQWADLDTALGWVLGAGGVAAIAHPARYKMSRTLLRKLLREFKDLGGQGLEVVSGTHSHDDNFQMAQLAERFGLLSSMGSDYHGPTHFWLELGAFPVLPKNCRGIWETWGKAAQPLT